MLKYSFNKNNSRLVGSYLNINSYNNNNNNIRLYSSNEESSSADVTQEEKPQPVITKPVRTMKDDLSIEDTIKSVKTKIIAMPFDYSYQSFYKNKKSTKKGVTKQRAHLKAFGAVPYVFPASMFREVKPPIPLSEINKNSTVTKQQQDQQQQQ
ncbi:hypothetical protein PPL_09292 [Heterostelium album PN500]|uniref:Uncharacterized protein n=1 Tax=Heterostelium pallidum (strain ATCC 26659 / Pp 5 / PN500) TaxID=670386 RepID=D3BL60_HETP5|nr:hypothetical protein PPL_09292 [Heterostelium album PN500]EFA77794.1 hypothetical protein PPL_09292 [Heterostelium album PN500]|eukprot:XP_020429922.1 hypothetical protein PPL_09292 [Heterostelium album PN500]